MRLLAIVTAGLSIAALSGCAGRSAAGGELSVYANGNASSMRMEGDRAWGPAAELEHFDDGYRGTLQGHVVDIHFTDDRVHGSVGPSRLDLHVSAVDGKVHGQGLMNGHLSTFDVDAESVEGTFGGCAYDMKRKGPDSDDYVGYQSCSGSIYPNARVTIPEYVHALPPLEQAALYALLFTG